MADTLRVHVLLSSTVENCKQQARRKFNSLPLLDPDPATFGTPLHHTDKSHIKIHVLITGARIM
jgi:hypothetical protein